MKANSLGRSAETEQPTTTNMKTNDCKCYGQYRFHDSVQETYESASRDARTRASELRKEGFRVIVSPLGPQVTSVGLVRMTMLTAYGNIDTLPTVHVERL